MASTDAKLFPTKNTAYRVTFDIRSNAGALVSGGTNTTTRSLDGAAFATATNNPSEIATSSGVWFLDLTAAEMNADTIAVKIVNNGTGAVPQVLVIYTLALVEPAAAPTFPMPFANAMAWLAAQAINKMTQTATTTTLRNAADSGNISTSTVSDDGTTYTRTKFT